MGLVGMFRPVSPENGESENNRFNSDGILSADFKYCITADTKIYLWGALYNKEDLMQKYKLHEKNCASIILDIYLLVGIDGFKDLDGGFLFVIYQPDKVLVCRDRHGIGLPFFYSDRYFASSLHEFRSFEDFEMRPSISSLITFLEIGYIPSPETSIEDVLKLPAGNCLIIESGKRYRTDLFGFVDFCDKSKEPKMSIDEAVGEYERLHKQAISRRIAGKNNVSLLLSGGYDSGGNLAALREIYTGNAKGFSVGFKNNPWTEVPLARLMSNEFGVDFFDYEIDGSEIESLPEIIKHLGDPFQEGGLMVNYSAMRMVNSYQPDVVLGGDGNDQHFGTSGKETALNYMFQRTGLNYMQDLFSLLSQNVLFDNDNLLFRIRFHNEKTRKVLRSDSFGYQGYQLRKLMKSGGNSELHSYLNEIPTSHSCYDDFFITRNYHIDIKQVINEVILFKASRMADLFENNISFPYMDAEIYHFLKRLPRGYKLRNSFQDIMKGHGVSKYLHKAYLKPMLPKEITERKKQGGFAPLSIFFSDKLKRDKIKAFILNSEACRVLFNSEYVKSVFDQYDSIEKNGNYWFWYKQVKSTQIFNLVVVALWWEIILLGNMRDSLSDYYAN